ncbi:Microprocessor complex subunit DGCR8/PASHA [Aphelenchoides fujianensis]|nr:Microprocessor complex subunit DGCR8/PASHA [Aphelenchoides fujianensis]
MEAQGCPHATNGDEQPTGESNGRPEEAEAGDGGSDIEELLESAVDVDIAKYPPGATVRKKRVLETRVADAFNVLPDGWIEITHDSGLPVYLHRATRVCTFSRPYFLGTSSVRHHKVPASSVPCFYMKKRQEELKNQKEPNLLSRLLDAPLVEMKASSAGDADQYLDDEQIFEYAKNLFKFKTIDVVRFDKWSDTRNFQRERKRQQGQLLGEVDKTDRPGLPADTKLISIPALSESSKPTFRTKALNPVGKSSVQLLHDFSQKIMKNTIKYKEEDFASAATPFRAIARLEQLNTSTKVQMHQSVEAKLKILQERYVREAAGSQEREEAGSVDPQEKGHIVLGIGFGTSKKNAKMAAAEKILNCLIPELKFDENHVVVDDDEDGEKGGSSKSSPEEVFDLMDICDTRVSNLCHRMNQPQPFVVLKELIRRNSTMADLKPELKTQPKAHQRCDYMLTVGKITTKVTANNKQDGRQRAAQAMLKELYPTATCYGDIFRMYNAEALHMQKEAQKYKRKLASQNAEELSEAFAISNETIGAELRSALASMDVRYDEQRAKERVFRPPIGFTSPPLPLDDCAHFGELCQRFAHLFADADLLNSMLE